MIKNLTLNLTRFAHKANENLLSSIKKDHDLIKYLYHEYPKQAIESNKIKISNEIIRQISIHSVAEEIVVYPIIKDKLGNDAYMECLSDHRKLKNDLYDLSSLLLGTETERFHIKFNISLKEFLDHSDTEENKLLPSLVEKLTSEENHQAAKTFIEKRNYVPTRPHPDAPDTQPMEDIVASMQAPIDKLLDKTRDYPEVVR